MAQLLVGVSEVAALPGVSNGPVDQLDVPGGFSGPAARLDPGPVWEREAVDAGSRATARQVTSTGTKSKVSRRTDA